MYFMVRHSRCSLPWVTINSSILFIAPMKKMILNWDIPIVTRLHRKMGENTDRRKGTVSERRRGFQSVFQQSSAV